jgi:hypothetical protein
MRWGRRLDIGAVEVGEVPPDVVVDGAPQLLLLQPEFIGVHDITPVQWIAFGPNAAALRVDVISSQDGVTFPIGADQPESGSLDWDTTQVPDGSIRCAPSFAMPPAQ